MEALRSIKIFTRLVSAFLLCATITLGVGFLGYSGITKLKETISGIVGNNLVSLYNASNVRANALAYSRWLHAALLYKYANADSDKFDR